MFLLTISLICSLATLTNTEKAASAAQFRFAVENNFDDTGPGAKQKEFAYKTYSNYEDALISYATDNNTKLPDADKHRAYKKLMRQDEYRTPQRYVHQSHNVLRNYQRPPVVPHLFIQPSLRYRANRDEEFKKYQHQQPIMRYQPKPVGEYTNSFLDSQRLNAQKTFQAQSQSFFPQTEPPQRIQYNTPQIPILDTRTVVKQLKLTKGLKLIKPIKESPIKLGHYSRETVQEATPIDESEINPEYTYSYGVHDRLTGDSKAAHETREGGTVRGFYTVADADGKQRTVHYTADDKDGFRAFVERTDINQQ